VIEPLKKLEGSTETGLGVVVQSMFKQLSILGVLGLMMFIVENSGIFHVQSDMFHVVKEIHFALFIVVALFLIFGSILTFRGLSQTNKWRKANHSSFGHQNNSHHLVREYTNLLRKGESIPSHLRDAIEFKSLRDRFVRDARENRKIAAKFNRGDVVKIVKQSSQFGHLAKVVDSTWNGRVQVMMIDEKGLYLDPQNKKHQRASMKSYLANEIQIAKKSKRRSSLKEFRKKRRILLKVGEIPKDFELNDYFALRLGHVMAKMVSISKTSWLVLDTVLILSMLVFHFTSRLQFAVFIISMGYGVMIFTLYLNGVLSSTLLELTSPYLLRCAHLEADVDKDLPLKRSQELARERQKLGLVTVNSDIEIVPPYKLRPMRTIQTHHKKSWIRRIFFGSARFPNQQEYLLIGGSQGESFTLDLMRLISFAIPLYTVLYYIFIMSSSTHNLLIKDQLWIRVVAFLIFLVLPNIVTFQALCDCVFKYVFMIYTHICVCCSNTKSLTLFLIFSFSLSHLSLHIHTHTHSETRSSRFARLNRHTQIHNGHFRRGNETLRHRTSCET